MLLGVKVAAVGFGPSCDGAALYRHSGLVDGDSDVVLVSGEPFVARVGDAGVAVGGSEVYCGGVCLSTGLCGGECQCAAEGLRSNYQRIGYGLGGVIGYGRGILFGCGVVRKCQRSCILEATMPVARSNAADVLNSPSANTAFLTSS